MLSLPLSLFACAGGGHTGSSYDVAAEWLGEIAAPFALEDVNPTSATYGQSVSPDQHLDRVSAWYFGHAT